LRPFGFALLVFLRWELQIPSFSLCQITNSAERGIFDGNKIESADDLYKILDDENQLEKIFKLEEIK
jgi:hypothetical protein